MRVFIREVVEYEMELPDSSFRPPDRERADAHVRALEQAEGVERVDANYHLRSVGG